MKTAASALLLSLHALTVSAACPSWPTAERFDIQDAEVTDRHTGLTWARCSVGQQWDGSTCVGNVKTLSLQESLQLAKNSVWRLPNVKELASLADVGCQRPSIDSVAFPGTPPYWYNTSTPDYSESYYIVGFSVGYVDVFETNWGGGVRWVRAHRKSERGGPPEFMGAVKP